MARVNEAQDIEALKQRHQELARLKAEAKAAYGTEDLAELEKLLAARKAANETKRADYQGALEQIEKELAEVEAKFEGRPGGGA